MRKRPSGFNYTVLEPRRLLVTARTLLSGIPDLSQPHQVVANYREDFGDEGTFAYHWNAPSNWQALGESGDLTQGNLRQTGLFRELNFRDHVFRPGNTGLKSNWPGSFLRLDSQGGHVGAHRFDGNAHDRFAIVSFEVESSGFYSIIQSHLRKRFAVRDGVEVKVWVGDDQVVKSVSTEANPRYSVDFDVNLGFVKRGEKIYLAVGAGETSYGDHFEWDFSIAKFEAVIVADYRDDFGGNSEAWSYLWNAPERWNQSKPHSGGAIGDVSFYQPLIGNGAKTPDGNLDGLDNDPAGFIRLNRIGGVVGFAANQVNSEDRFAIGAFEIPASGYYAIVDSLLEKSRSLGNGLELVVHDSKGTVLLNKFIGVKDKASFDMQLGFLPQGETIYVGVGSGGDHIADVFYLDYTIAAEPMLRPEPVREFDVGQTLYVRDFGALADDGKDDQEAIQRAIRTAARIQKVTGRSIAIQMDSGSYRLGIPGSDNLIFSRLSNLVFQGKGEELTQLLFTHPDASGLRIADCHNVILRDFSIDYEALPFTQGTVNRVVDRNTVWVQVDEGYEAPNSESLFHRELSSHRTQFLHRSRTGRMINSERSMVADLDSIRRVSDAVYEVSYRNSLPNSVSAGDAWYQIARINKHGNINLYRNTGFVTVEKVTSFAGPSSFVQGQGNDLVNVIDVRVDLHEDRLVSVLADGVHAARNRFGVWVEGSTFVGLSDDVINVYRQELEVEIEQVMPNRFRLSEVDRDFLAGERVVFYRSDGFRQEAKLHAIVGNEIFTDRPIRGFDSETKIVPFNHATAGSIIRDNVIERHRAGLGSVIVWSPQTTLLGNSFAGINTHAIATNAYQSNTLSDGLIVQGNYFEDVGFSSFRGERNRAAIETGLNTHDNIVLDNVFTRLFGNPLDDHAIETIFDTDAEQVDGKFSIETRSLDTPRTR